MAILVFLEVHVEALPDETEAVRVLVSPGFSFSDEWLSFMTGDLTSILHIFLTPSTVALMTALPCLWAVTRPFSSTETILCLFDFQTGARPDETSHFIEAD